MKHQNELIYVATPYTHKNAHICQHRFEQVSRYCAKLISRGHRVFSPITHSHPFKKYGVPTTWEFWKEYDRFYLEHSTLLDVYMQWKWTTSVGVAEEIILAQELNVPIRFTKELLPVHVNFAALTQEEIARWTP